MAVKHLLLGALSTGEAHGYRICARLAALPGLGRPIESARVYSALAALEHEGAISAREDRLPGGRTRRVFQPTREGRAQLERWLEHPVAAAEWLRRPLLARLAIGAAPGSPSSVAELPALRAAAAARRRALAGSRGGDLRASSEIASRAAGPRSAATGGDARSRLEELARWRVRRHLEIEAELLEELALLAEQPAAAEASASVQVVAPPVAAQVVGRPRAPAAAVSSPPKPPTRVPTSR